MVVWSWVLSQYQKNFALFGHLKPVVGPRLIPNSPAPYNAITCILITQEFQIFVGKVSIEVCAWDVTMLNFRKPDNSVGRPSPGSAHDRIFSKAWFPVQICECFYWFYNPHSSSPKGTKIGQKCCFWPKMGNFRGYVGIPGLCWCVTMSIF